mmetsp:Transcript_15669/g.42241  ORF Transcript_15669/g.42241 Transcript_15669/m.42241 type:complete len:264 (+) Transcript_15669:1014-1805(+)
MPINCSSFISSAPSVTSIGTVSPPSEGACDGCASRRSSKSPPSTASMSSTRVVPSTNGNAMCSNLHSPRNSNFLLRSCSYLSASSVTSFFSSTASSAAFFNCFFFCATVASNWRNSSSDSSCFASRSSSSPCTSFFFCTILSRRRVRTSRRCCRRSISEDNCSTGVLTSFDRSYWSWLSSFPRCMSSLRRRSLRLSARRTTFSSNSDTEAMPWRSAKSPNTRFSSASMFERSVSSVAFRSRSTLRSAFSSLTSERKSFSSRSV